jgi:uncharacterized membrane protein YidH (DUF202 family)
MRPPDRKLPRFPVDPMTAICLVIVVAIVVGLVLVMAFDVLPARN